MSVKGRMLLVLVPAGAATLCQRVASIPVNAAIGVAGTCCISPGVSNGG